MNEVEVMTQDDEQVASGRAAKVAVLLRDGERLKVAQVAEICSMTWRGAYRLLHVIAIYLPITVDNEGYWHWIDE